MRTIRIARASLLLGAALALGACDAAATDQGAAQAPPPQAPAPQAPAPQATSATTPAPAATPAPAPAVPPQDLGSTEGSPVGVWIAPDGSTAFILENGVCSGMYYNNGTPLDIGGGMTCAYSGNTLVVMQPPNQISYKVHYTGDTMTITNGSMSITFTQG